MNTRFLLGNQDRGAETWRNRSSAMSRGTSISHWKRKQRVRITRSWQSWKARTRGERGAYLGGTDLVSREHISHGTGR
ncbi:MAG: hypothetical protein MW690_001652 [Methanophagales archaeon]|nr:hypothetical protein [Methanophagales archaeon]